MKMYQDIVGYELYFLRDHVLPRECLYAIQHEAN